MAYYLNLFSPETYQSFCNSDQDVTGFNINQLSTAKKIVPGDRFICYLTKLSRWIGIFEVASMYFVDRTPMFLEENDPFVVRFKIKPVFWLGYEYGIPIQEDFFGRNYPLQKIIKKLQLAGLEY
ncbi:MAG: hypothetical protein E6230_15925 [Paenibacillus dendritiformis]|uniref:hypothetical protein n=1 Tax=uncultured Paenibacillus sp. TaxID=227322 RepID=UPI0025D81F6A|nr:hypothetical protein [uncultured Paenibacillus sp.]MDU5143666.1 hypothetical protein [Paenibacillus dendritiformis]